MLSGDKEGNVIVMQVVFASGGAVGPVVWGRRIDVSVTVRACVGNPEYA